MACDAAGDFVVTWSEQDAGDWNVWASEYGATASCCWPPSWSTRTTTDVQEYSAVGMDADGDFVITWQSLNQDGSGWGIYAQRYDSAGNPLGGQDEAQLITFVGQPRGTFTLYWDNGGSGPHQTGSISYQGNGAATASRDPNRVGQNRRHGQGDRHQRHANPHRVRRLQANQDQPQIVVHNRRLQAARGAQINIATTVNGATGEFRVNDTTANNQMFPAIAMNASGAFVISWTGYGQDGDAAYQSNVYAKSYESSESLDLTSQRTTLAGQYNYEEPSAASVDNQIVSVDNPANHVVTPGTGYDGVVEVEMVDCERQRVSGSGSLLSGRPAHPDRRPRRL